MRLGVSRLAFVPPPAEWVGEAGSSLRRRRGEAALYDWSSGASLRRGEGRTSASVSAVPGAGLQGGEGEEEEEEGGGGEVGVVAAGPSRERGVR